MASVEVLREKQEVNRTLYRTHRESVLALQQALHSDVLPEVATELALDESSLHWAKEWIEDDGSVFRMLKKHKFRVGDACVALRQTLHWRISILAPLQKAAAPSLPSFVQCLPHDATDIVGHPVMLIRLDRLSDGPEEIKHEFLCEYDAMRRRLSQLQRYGVCQCLIMVDFKDANIRSTPVDLIPWFVRDVAPRFPGLCAGVLMVNYTWAYSGIYNLVKRLLPSTVLERICFPTQSELLCYFERNQLPKEYGGDLDLTPPHPDILVNIVRPNLPLREDPCHHMPPPHVNIAAYLPSMSLLNPFYGYPAITSPGSSIPQLKSGRRRKRDLARTLARLWLAKLKKTANKTWLWIVMTLVLWIAELRR